jgi:hypothetical protein
VEPEAARPEFRAEEIAKFLFRPSGPCRCKSFQPKSGMKLKLCSCSFTNIFVNQNNFIKNNFQFYKCVDKVDEVKQTIDSIMFFKKGLQK